SRICTITFRPRRSSAAAKACRCCSTTTAPTGRRSRPASRSEDRGSATAGLSGGHPKGRLPRRFPMRNALWLLLVAFLTTTLAGAEEPSPETRDLEAALHD